MEELSSLPKAPYSLYSKIDNCVFFNILLVRYWLVIKNNNLQPKLAGSFVLREFRGILRPAILATAILLAVCSGAFAQSAVAVLSATSLDFGVFNAPGGLGSQADLHVTNSGNAPLVFQSIQITGTNAGEFYVDTSLCRLQGVAPLNTCPITVGISPKTPGPKTATLVLTDSADNSPQVVQLTGSAVPQAQLTVSPSSLDFGDQALDTSGAPQTFTLANSGGRFLLINYISVAEPAFRESAPGDANACVSMPTYLATGESCTISIAFHPFADGAQRGAFFVSSTIVETRQTVTTSYPMTGVGTGFPIQPPPVILTGGVVPNDSKSTTIQTGEWISIYGSGLAGGVAVWNGDFPTILSDTSVMVDFKPAYLWYASPTQLNVQVADDTNTGAVQVTVTTPAGTANLNVTLGQFAPAFSLFDTTHVAAIIVRSDGSGAYGGGAYDILGPTGSSLGFATVAAKAGDSIELFGVGFGPTTPAVPAGHIFTGAAPTTNSVGLRVNNLPITPSFAGLSGAGLYQINFTMPANVGTGDVPLLAAVGGVQTDATVVISLQ